MNYKTLIKNWHKKASKQRDIFSRFVFEYLAFIAIIKTQIFKLSEDNHDRAFLQRFKRETIIRDKYLDKIITDKELRNNWQIIIGELNTYGLGSYSGDPFIVEEIKWWNCSHEKITQKTKEEIDRFTGILYGFNDWENMIEFWYSIRNNLFHGTKDPEKKRDQLLIDYGYRTIHPLIQILIKMHLQ